MTALSYKKYYETMATDALQSDHPLSAFRAWNTRDNLQHIIDSAHQYRVNWTAADGEYVLYTGNTVRPILRWAFPCIVTRADRYSSFDVRVGAIMPSGLTAATTALVSARLRPHSTPNGYAQAFWQTTVPTSAVSAHWAIDARVTFTLPTPWFQSVQNFTVVEASIFRTVSAPVIVFEVDVAVQGVGNAAAIAAQVREYP